MKKFAVYINVWVAILFYIFTMILPFIFFKINCCQRYFPLSKNLHNSLFAFLDLDILWKSMFFTMLSAIRGNLLQMSSIMNGKILNEQSNSLIIIFQKIRYTYINWYGNMLDPNKSILLLIWLFWKRIDLYS